MNWLAIVPGIVRRLFRRKKDPNANNHVPPDPGQGYSNPNGRGWLTALALHDRAESMAIGRAAEAMGYGLPAGQFVSKFAGQSSTVHNHGGGFVKGALMTLLLGAVFGPLGYLAATGFDIFKSSTTQKETKIDPEEYEIDLEVIDGKLVPTEVRPVQPTGEGG